MSNDLYYQGTRQGEGNFVETAFHVGDRVLGRREGIFCHATIEAVDTPTSSSSNSNSNPEHFGNSSSGAGGFYYYVHFADADRRMDMWLSGDDIRVLPNQQPGAGLTKKSKASMGKSSVSRNLTRRNTLIQQQQQQMQQQQQQQQSNERSNSREVSQTSTTAAATGGTTTSLSIADITATAASQTIAAAQQGGGPVSHQGKHPLAHSTRNTESKFFDRPRNVAKFYIGDFEVDSWYYSPQLLAHPLVRQALDNLDSKNVWASLPGNATLSVQNQNQQQQNQKQKVPPNSIRNFNLHLCPFCFEPALDHVSIEQHVCVCKRRPPGREIYRDPTKKVMLFECDGAVHAAFARNLALVSKAFLEHKSLDWDMQPFVFYVLCRYDEKDGCKICGYFSREKESSEGYNLSCILTLPQYQSAGLGRFLIDVSYEMNRREGRPGTPEKPLSDFGERMYHSAWRERVLDALAAHAVVEHSNTSLDQLIRATGMIRNDVCTALSQLKILDKSVLPRINIVVPPELLRNHLTTKIKRMRGSQVIFEPALLHWFPQWYNPRCSLNSDVARGELRGQTPNETALVRVDELLVEHQNQRQQPQQNQNNNATRVKEEKMTAKRRQR